MSIPRNGSHSVPAQAQEAITAPMSPDEIIDTARNSLLSACLFAGYTTPQIIALLSAIESGELEASLSIKKSTIEWTLLIPSRMLDASTGYASLTLTEWLQWLDSEHNNAEVQEHA